MKRWIGRTVIGIGALHSALGFAAGAGIADDIMREGFFGTIGGQLNRQAVFWFLFFGFLVVTFGCLLDWLEARALVPPPGIGYGLLGMSVVGASMMPASGWWLLLIPACGLIYRARGTPAT